MFKDTPEYAININGISKVYKQKNGDIDALKSISLKVPFGQVCTIFGPNGAGKTTLIKIIAGLIYPEYGSFSIGGRTKVPGVVLEGSRSYYWRLTPLENLIYFGVLRGMRKHEASLRAEKLLTEFDLAHKKNVLVSNLSKGMQQRLSIAAAIIHNPSLIILDEPTLGLDLKSIRELYRTIDNLRNDGLAILIATHDFSLAEKSADRIIVIDRGKIVLDAEKRSMVENGMTEKFTLTFIDPLPSFLIDLAKIDEKLKIIDDYTISVTGGVPVLKDIINKSSNSLSSLISIKKTGISVEELLSPYLGN